MKRFFFGLQGGQNTDDPHGLLYASDLAAFRAAEKLAAELSRARPNLRGNTCVVIAPRGADDLYCVSIWKAAASVGGLFHFRRGGRAIARQRVDKYYARKNTWHTSLTGWRPFWKRKAEVV